MHRKKTWHGKYIDWHVCSCCGETIEIGEVVR